MMSKFSTAVAGIILSAATLAVQSQKVTKVRPESKPSPTRGHTASEPSPIAANASASAEGDAVPALRIDLRAAIDQAATAPEAVVVTAPPSAQPELSDLAEPGEALAKSSIATVDRAETEWNALWKAVDAASRAQTKSFDLFCEATTVEALRKYSLALRDESKVVHDSYVSLSRGSEKLKDALTKAPTYLREAARLYDEYARETKTEEVAENYRSLRDLWLARATIFEKRGNDFGKYYDPKTVEFLSEYQLFFSRFVIMLDSYLTPAFREDQHARFNERMKSYLKHLNRFRDGLKRLRESALEQAENEDVRGAIVHDRTEALVAYLDAHASKLGPPVKRHRDWWEDDRESRHLVGEELLPGQSFPIVRVNRTEGRLSFVGSLDVLAREGWPKVEVGRPPLASPDDYLVKASTNLPAWMADDKLYALIRTTLSRNSELRAAKLKAETEKQEREQRLALLASDSAELEFPKSNARDATQHDAKYQLNGTRLLFPLIGDELAYYRKDDLLKGVFKPHGVVKVTGVDWGLREVYLKRRSGGLYNSNTERLEVVVLTPTAHRSFASGNNAEGRPETTRPEARRLAKAGS